MKPPFNAAELFIPGRLGPYTLPHRVLMAPMTRNRARRDGVPSPSAVIYYAQRASAGMIVTETTTVSEQAVGYPLMPGIHTPDQVAGWERVVEAVHRFGCRAFLQLFHAGRVSHPSLQPGNALPVAPSPISTVTGRHSSMLAEVVDRKVRWCDLMGVSTRGRSRFPSVLL